MSVSVSHLLGAVMYCIEKNNVPPVATTLVQLRRSGKTSLAWVRILGGLERARKRERERLTL